MYNVVDGRNVQASCRYICRQQDRIRRGFETLEVFQPLFLLQLRMQGICFEFQKLEQGYQPPDTVDGRKEDQRPSRIP